LAKKNHLKQKGTISHLRGGKGLFITFEGSEGSGKSTHARALFKYLKKKGYDCIFTREPGGTPAGDRIRKILLREKNVYINEACELFLFEAARAVIVDQVILPALKKGKIVVCDRFYDATTVYQGYAAGLNIGFIKKVNNLATKGLKPDLTVLLDIGSGRGLKRALKNRRPDRMESKSLSFHKRVRSGYLKLARQEPGRIKVVKSEESIGEVEQDIRGVVLKCLSRI